MGSIGKSISSVVSKITPWNDKTEGLFGINKLTPWNDNTTTGQIANAALLAAAAYFGAQALSGATTAEKATLGSSLTPTPGVTAAPGAIVPYSEAGAINALQAGAQSYPYWTSAYSGVPAFSGNWATSAAAANPAVGSGIGSWIINNPMPTAMLGAGTLTGVGSYLSGKAQAKAQKYAADEQARQFNLTHNYGGSFGESTATMKSPKSGIRQIETVVDAREVALRAKYDPDYRNGFATMARKLIDPETALNIINATQKIT